MAFKKIENKELSKLFSKSSRLRNKDRIKLRKIIRKTDRQKEISPEDIENLSKEFNKAEDNFQNIKNSIPKITFDENLPINTKRDEIKDLIINNQVVIIAGETGSGKTTQIPKICLEAGRGLKGEIACTQPRRIAAVSVSERIAEELGQSIGDSVGYKIRFGEKRSKNTVVKIMTDGILLAETLSDKYLDSYDTIIIDEAHERSLNIDFILGFLSNLIKKRKDLKLIITSATIDTEKFSKAFDNAPIIEVSGRMYPVETIYLPPEVSDNKNEEPDLSKLAADSVDLLNNEEPGDILIFMPTENDIIETMEKLKGRKDNKTTILPLYARLPAHMQQKVFKPVSGRKIVISTNVAETSLTIPGIKYVIDTGLARIPKYIASSRTTSLLVSPISKSSADQRMGRCGRVSNGICIRLYSEENYNERPRFTLPEILRSNLADVLLKMTALKLGNIKDFPFIDRPESKNINDGYNLLTELDAIRETKKPGFYKLTATGEQMSKIPLDPKLSRMLIMASHLGCLDEVAVIVSGLTANDPREYPEDAKEKALQAQRIFVDPISDFMTLLNIWEKYKKESQNKFSTGATGKFSKKYFMSFRRLKEWRDLYSQIKDILFEEKIKDINLNISKSIEKNQDVSPAYEAIHKSILSGYLSNIAVKTEKNFFKAAKNREVMIFPGSGIFNKTKDWIVSAEIVETSRLFARTAGYIKPEWAAETGSQLLKQNIFDPHYEKDSGRVVAYAQKSLFGLVLVADEKVSYGKINRDDASRIFISQALLTGEIKNPPEFLKKNIRLADEITDLEERLRKRDILVSEDAVIDFYEKRIPGVFDIRTLRNIVRKKGDKFLLMKKQDLMNYDPENTIKDDFPDFLEVGEEKFKFSYSFNPGEKNDGVTISIPAQKAAAVSKEHLEPVVPGLLKEKIEAVLRGLPKKYRTAMNPIREKAEIIHRELKPDNKPLAMNLSKFIKKRFNINIPPRDIADVEVSDHLKMRIELTDAKGSRIKVSRNPLILKTIDNSNLPDSKKITKFKNDFQKQDIKEFQTIPKIVKVYPDMPNSPVFYPGYQAVDNSINLKLFKTKQEADNSNISGVKEFYLRKFPTEIKNLKKQVKLKNINKNLFSLFQKKEDIEKGLFDSIINEVFCKNIKDEAEFTEYADKVKAERRLNFLTQEKMENTISTLENYFETMEFLKSLEAKYFSTKLILELILDCQKNLREIVPLNFYSLYSKDEIARLPKYIKALQIRSQRGIAGPAKDSQKRKTIEKLQAKLKILLGELSENSSNEKKNLIEEFFWDIEELKVSVFAQELKTSYPVSEKKLEKKFMEIAKMI